MEFMPIGTGGEETRTPISFTAELTNGIMLSLRSLPQNTGSFKRKRYETDSWVLSLPHESALTFLTSEASQPNKHRSNRAQHLGLGFFFFSFLIDEP